MVGRCISYWNSPFLGDMLVFQGVICCEGKEQVRMICFFSFLFFRLTGRPDDLSFQWVYLGNPPQSSHVSEAKSFCILSPLRVKKKKLLGRLVLWSIFLLFKLFQGEKPFARSRQWFSGYFQGTRRACRWRDRLCHILGRSFQTSRTAPQVGLPFPFFGCCLSKKSPTGPTEWTPKPKYLIALATYLGVRW